MRNYLYFLLILAGAAALWTYRLQVTSFVQMLGVKLTPGSQSVTTYTNYNQPIYPAGPQATIAFSLG
jgi:hypothetical protein